MPSHAIYLQCTSFSAIVGIALPLSWPAAGCVSGRVLLFIFIAITLNSSLHTQIFASC